MFYSDGIFTLLAIILSKTILDGGDLGDL